MVSNTTLADINEIYLAYLLAGSDWRHVGKSKQVRAQLNRKIKEAGEDHAHTQMSKAKAMYESFTKWSKDSVKRTWWVARPDELRTILKQEIKPRDNPSDVLCLMSDGSYLGLSAKSTNKRSGGIQFKNLGSATIEKDLNIKIASLATEVRESVADEWEMDSSQRKMSDEFRKKPHRLREAKFIGDGVLKAIRNRLLAGLKKTNPDKVRDHITDNWLNVGEMVYPPYVKVTGFGSKEPFTAKIETLADQEQSRLLMQGKLTFEKQGDNTIGVRSDGKKIMRMRAKWRDLPVSSPIKFSGEPW